MSSTTLEGFKFEFSEAEVEGLFRKYVKANWGKLKKENKDLFDKLIVEKLDEVIKENKSLKSQIGKSKQKIKKLEKDLEHEKTKYAYDKSRSEKLKDLIFELYGDDFERDYLMHGCECECGCC